MRRQRQILALALLVLATACAHGLALKQNVATGLQANEVALTQARQSELALYQSKAIPAYGAAQHLAFINALDKAQQGVVIAAKAAQAWQPGSPTPPGVTDYKGDVDAILKLLEALGGNPAAADAIRAAQKLVAEAQALVNLVRGK